MASASFGGGDRVAGTAVKVAGNTAYVPMHGGVQETLVLADNVSATGAQPERQAYGGDYIYTAVGTFGGASVQLQSQGPDGAWMNVGAAKTAADATGGTGVGLGSAAIVRANVTGGTPSGLYVSLSRIP